MVSLSDAYRKGLNSAFNVNPYQEGTEEYNDFERGWTQRLKRTPESVSSRFLEVSTRYDQGGLYEPKPPSRAKPTQGSSYNPYAAAKGK